MPNTPQRLVDRFIAVSEEAAVQSAIDVGLVNADINMRHRCEISVQEVVERNEVRDCRNEYLVDETLRTRALRFTLTYTDVTPQILALWLAYFKGAQAGPVGTPANEEVLLSRTGTVSGGAFKIQVVLEGRTVVTGNIAWNASAQDIIDALTHPRMFFIQPGDIAVTGDWTSGYTIEFTGRLANANIPTPTVTGSTVTGGGSVGIAASVDGDQNMFDITDSTSRVKPRLSFVLGWENVTDRFEKYIGYVVESYSITAERRQNVGLTVSLVGPWAPEILTSFTVPPCLNPQALVTDDCRVSIDNNWETTDVNSLSITLNDNVPVDESSAFGFDSVDVQTLERGDQPAFDILGSVFASEVDPLYTLALNERTANTVEAIFHFGMPGDRVTLFVDYGKLKFQDNRLGFAGTLNKSVVNFQITPYRLSTDYPVYASAALDQAVAFLQTST